MGSYFVWPDRGKEMVVFDPKSDHVRDALRSPAADGTVVVGSQDDRDPVTVTQGQ